MIKTPFGFTTTAAEAVSGKRPDEPMQGVARYAVDAANAERLWKISEEMCRSGRH